MTIPGDPIKAPLHDEGRYLVLHLSCFGVLHWCLGKHSEHLSYTSIADPVGERDSGALIGPPQA